MKDWRDQDLQILARDLQQGALDLAGQFTWGSNYTFLARVQGSQGQLEAVYKPVQGERPLWDFPRQSLAQREVAAWLTSETLGWKLVPPTVLREGGPLGEGSLQLYVEHNPEHHYFTFTDQERQRLRPVAVFDVLINNADRKGGHIIMHPEGSITLIDHGVCFHKQYKLRTVVWDFIGEPIPEDLVMPVKDFSERLRGDPSLRERYLELLSPQELEALQTRADRLIQEPVFPEQGPGRPYPWPMV